MYILFYMYRRIIYILFYVVLLARYFNIVLEMYHYFEYRGEFYSCQFLDMLFTQTFYMFLL